MIPIVQACARPPYTRIIAVMASQMGKTAGLLNVIGHRLMDDPTPLIYVGPTRHTIDTVIEPKVMDLIKGVPSLWEGLQKGKTLTKTHKRINGISLRLAWAGSAAELASDSASVVMVDEVDRMGDSVQGEGNVVELCEARTATYPDGRIIATSTPTLGLVETFVHPVTHIEHWAVSENVSSPVWRLWQAGSRHEWAWPCPHCDAYFIPRSKHLVWPKEASLDIIAKEAVLICPACEGCITDSQKTLLNSKGVYLAPGECVTEQREVMGTADTAASTTGSFWVSGIASFSPKKTLGFLAQKLASAQRSGEPERLQSVFNTDFGELFSLGGEAPSWGAVLERKHGYRSGQIPEGMPILTMGVDVQKNRLVYVLRAWGQDWESALIEHGELWGETTQPGVWQALSRLIQGTWQGEPLSGAAIDSGYQTEAVYRFCRLHKGLAHATKGHAHLDKPYYRSTLGGGSNPKAGLALWHYNSDQLKSWVHARLQWPVDQPGGWWLPEDISDDYCKQLVAEQRVVNKNGKVTWIKLKKDNHYLDCEVLAYLMVRLLTGDREDRLAPQRPRREPGTLLSPGLWFEGGELCGAVPEGYSTSRERESRYVRPGYTLCPNPYAPYYPPGRRPYRAAE